MGSLCGKGPGVTHYAGCPCHEALRDAEYAALKACADVLADAVEAVVIPAPAGGRDPGYRLGEPLRALRATLAKYREVTNG